ncbi:Transcriptional regulator, AcrR family [hydrothermal vent metagenome]|uniref:Transcriptional regulator, AcrR family n=1 Tax=hydrothermal vent metagenome TaxID=652676 RepID=A0A3B0WHW3_9ZZZZ
MENKTGSKREVTHQRILKAVHSGFRKHGYEGAGVDGLAKEADVTSGAFYAHFGSKAGAFREAIHEGLAQVKEAVTNLQEEYGDNWLDEFSDFYLGEKRCDDLSNSCAMQSLTSEVARSDDETRSIFQSDMLEVVEVFAKGLSEKDNNENSEKAWATISMLIGGVTLARAVKDPRLADNIVNSVQNTIKKSNKTNTYRQ